MAPKAIFKGQTFAISGKLSQPRKDYEELIKKHGGEIASSVTTAVTFLISNEDDVKACPQKVATAIGRGIPIVQEGFVGASVAAKKVLEAKFFSVKGAAKKRKAEAKVEPKAEAKRAKPSKPVSTSATSAVIFKSGLADKASVVQEEISKGFVKATLVWDVELVLNDPAKGKDRFYNMQLLKAKEGEEYWAVQHWGRTGLDGRVHVDGPFGDVQSAKAVFRKKYRMKTGNAWGQLGGSFVEHAGKYKLLNRDAKKEAKGTWQYYLHNEVNGKDIGWYDYEGAAADNMEKYWRQFESNDGLAVRFVQTDYFKYEINFTEMFQTNTKSGMRRVIRRVPAGEEPSAAAPAKIPEPAKPAAPAPESSDDEDEDAGAEVEEEEDEAEEEEEAAAEDADAAGAEDAGDDGAEEAPIVGRAPPNVAAAASSAPPSRTAAAKDDAEAETQPADDEMAAETLPMRR